MIRLLKRCIECKEKKAPRLFYKTGHTADGLTKTCRVCLMRLARDRAGFGPLPERLADRSAEIQRRCEVIRKEHMFERAREAGELI